MDSSDRCCPRLSLATVAVPFLLISASLALLPPNSFQYRPGGSEAGVGLETVQTALPTSPSLEAGLSETEDGVSRPPSVQKFLDWFVPKMDAVMSEFPNFAYDLPKSLIVAQAGLESGWGSSYSAKNRRNLFGLTDGRGSLRTFDTVEDSIRTYVRTLSRHPAYADFRDKLGKVSVFELTNELEAYADNPEYSQRLKQVIRSQELHRLDAKALENDSDRMI